MQGQWNKKKQTKKEASAARRAKLDPDSELNRNAKEVMDERAKNKRKLREMKQEEEDWEDEDDNGEKEARADGKEHGKEDGQGDEIALQPADGDKRESPGEGLKQRKHDGANKKQKVESASEEKEEQPSQVEKQLLSKKKQKKRDKKAKAKDQRAEQRAANGVAKTDVLQAGQGQEAQSPEPPAHSSPSEVHQESQPAQARATRSSTEPENEKDEGDLDTTMLSFDLAGSREESDQEEPADGSSRPGSDAQSRIFDAKGGPARSTEPASTTTSISSSAVPSGKPKHIKIPADSPELRARLAAKIEALRAARKADGPDGKPIRTRQELIESRRAKQAQRKAHKKELRKVARLEEERKREEALASNSPSVMSPAGELDEATGKFAFGRVAFGDGAQLSHDLGYVLNRGQKKGPSDPKTALTKVQNQKKHLQDMDEEKRKDVAEKESWLNARRRVEGEKIHDDETMLKRAVKRKDAAKKKSEKAWRERVRGVEMAQKERQRKREENLRKRRDEKLLGKAGKKNKKKKKPAGAADGANKKKRRPGFEGSLGLGRK